MVFVVAVLLTLPFASLAPAATLPEAILAENDSLATVLIAGREGLDAVLPDYYGATALMIAAERDNVGLTARLLEAGADPDARDINGDTALNWAAYYGHIETARALLEAGADPSLAGHGNTLEIAVRRGFDDFARLVADTTGVLREPARWETRVLNAIGSEDANLLREALRDGRGPDVRDDLGRPALHVAAGMGDDELVRILIAAGCDPEAQDLNGFTALMIAARERHLKVASVLLEAGAKVQHEAGPQALRLTPMHMAAIGGDSKVTRLLARWGAEKDARDTDGTVPMLWALSEGNIECVVALIDLGADPTIANGTGLSVADIAQEYDMQPILDAIGE